jgi:hypothetical protein
MWRNLGRPCAHLHAPHVCTDAHVNKEGMRTNRRTCRSPCQRCAVARRAAEGGQHWQAGTTATTNTKCASRSANMGAATGQTATHHGVPGSDDQSSYGDWVGGAAIGPARGAAASTLHSRIPRHFQQAAPAPGPCPPPPSHTSACRASSSRQHNLLGSWRVCVGSKVAATHPLCLADNQLADPQHDAACGHNGLRSNSPNKPA